MDQCLAVKYPSNPFDRCTLLTTPGNKYCPLHQTYSDVKDYVHIPNPTTNDSEPDTNTPISPIIYKHIIPKEKEKEKENLISTKKSSSFNSSSQNITKTQRFQPARGKIQNQNQTQKTTKDEKIHNVTHIYKQSESDIQIKLLIMDNDDKHTDRIKELIGPVYYDPTLSEDSEDPYTMDQFWTLSNGIKVKTSINKYYLFSYKDSKNKIRCMTIFSINDMIKDNYLTHPVTNEPIPPEAVARAKELIDLYNKKLNLFGSGNSEISDEYRIKNKVTKLFGQFHRHSIFFEEKWLTTITTEDLLLKIIHITHQMIKNNLGAITSGKPKCTVFNRVFTFASI